ncbi:MAG: repeat-containing protein [Gemmataceae bacterium]|nr:repeat-containing protein [Gemmataceae bacterium]
MTSPTPPLDRRPWLGPAVIAAAVLAAYLNSFSGVFLLDDTGSIVQNPLVHDLEAAVRELATDLRPVTTLSLAVNYAVGGLDPAGYHAVNLAVHVVAALTLYGLVRRTLLLPPSAGTFGPAAGGLALAIALLWALHPLHTESVTYVVQRAQALAGVFQLLTLYCLVRGAAAGRGGWKWYAAAVATCAVGMGCKQDMVVAPVLTVAYDRVFLAGSWRGVARRGWVHAALFATWLVLAPSVGAALGPPSGIRADAIGSPGTAADPTPSAGFGTEGVTPIQYALTQTEVVLHYLRLAVWPRPLCLDYFDWPVARRPADVAAAVVGIVALLVGTGWALWRRPGVGFLGAWVFLTLAPTSTIMPIDDVAFEHRMYLPLAGVVALAVLGGWALLRDLVARRQLDPGPARRLGVGAAVAVAVVFGLGTAARNEDYHSVVGMWQDVVAHRPANWRARHNLANALVRAGRDADAVGHYVEAVRVRPNALDHALLAQTLVRCGREDEAVPHFREAVRRVPQERRSVEPPPPAGELHFNLALALDRRGELDEALTHYREAARLTPERAGVWINMSRPMVKRGDWTGAAECLRAALRADPDVVLAHTNLGLVLDRLDRFDEAVGHWRRAVDLAPNSALAYRNWAAGLVKRGNLSAAEGVLRDGLAACPLDPGLTYSRAHVARLQGRADESRALYRRARELDPDWPATAARTAWVLATAADAALRDPPEAVRLGEQAAQATFDQDAGCLDVLGAAYAAAGRFAEAVHAARSAEALARARRPDQAAAIRSRLGGYESNRPYHVAVPRWAGVRPPAQGR